MFNIDNFLEKFKNLVPADKEVKDLTVKVIKNTLGFEVKDSEIFKQNEVLFIKTKPIYKNEIFMNKQKILTEIKKTLGKRAPKDIF